MFYKRKRDSETYKRAVCMGIQLGARMVIKLELLKELLKSFPQVIIYPLLYIRALSNCHRP